MATKAERKALSDAGHRERIAARLTAAQDGIQDLSLSRHIWRTTVNIADANMAITQSFFVYWMSSQYAQAACSAVRRLTESGPKAQNTNSLVAALEDLATHARSFPWQFWMPADYRGADGCLDPQRIQRDIDDLRTAAEAVRVYVNQHLAHLDRHARMAVPTLAQLDAAIDLLGDVLHRYVLLTSGVDLEITPRLIFNWTEVFDQPWRVPLAAGSEVR